MFAIIGANNKIESVFSGNPNYIVASSTSTIITVPDNFQASVGDDIRMWDANWNRLPELECISAGYLSLPDDEEIVDGVLQEKSISEKISEGLISIPDGYFLDVDRFVEMTVEQKVIAGLLSLEQFKQDAATHYSRIATNAIYAAYPIFAQQNLLSDSTYSVNVIAIEMSKSADKIYGEMYTLIGTRSTCAELLEYREQIGSVDMTDFVSAVSTKLQPGLVTAYRTVLYSIISYKLIKIVRMWCNQMIALATSCNSLPEVQSAAFTACPDIT